MDQRPQHDPDSGDACECFGCHVGSLTIGLPRDFKSRTYGRVAPRAPSNSYEKGIPVSVRPDGSRVPYLRSDGEHMGQVEFDRKKHLVDDNRRKLESQSALTPT